MKKHAASLVTAAMLLTVAWMTGCDSGKVEQSSADSDSLETAVETVPASAETVAAEAEAETETTAESQTDQWETYFETYDAFSAAMAEQYPGVLMCIPPQILSDEWDLQGVTLYQPKDEAPYYLYDMTDLEQHRIHLLVSVTKTYDSIETERMDVLAYFAGWGYEVAEAYSTEGYFILQSSETAQNKMFGRTGDGCLYYCLSATDADGVSLEPVELQNLHDAMRL